MNYKIELFRGNGTIMSNPKKWYWRLVSTRNGKIVADGAEGYASRSNCRRAVRRLSTIRFGQIEVVEVENR